MAVIRRACLALRGNSLHPHHFHQAPDSLATHSPVSLSQFAHQLALPVERPARVKFIQITHDLPVLRTQLWPAHKPIAVHRQKGALAPQAQLGVVLVDHGFSFRSIPSSTHFFLRKSFSITSCPTLRSRRALARSVCAASAFASDFEPNTSGNRSCSSFFQVLTCTGWTPSS